MPDRPPVPGVERCSPWPRDSARVAVYDGAADQAAHAFAYYARRLESRLGPAGRRSNVGPHLLENGEDVGGE